MGPKIPLQCSTFGTRAHEKVTPPCPAPRVCAQRVRTWVCVRRRHHAHQGRATCVSNALHGRVCTRMTHAYARPERMFNC